MGLSLKEFLPLKWITPVCNGIFGSLIYVFDCLEQEIETLASKYEHSFTDIENSLSSVHNELTTLISQLSGDEYSLLGINELVNRIK